jgi:hypothetical protein
MKSDELLVCDRFPRASKYHPVWFDAANNLQRVLDACAPPAGIYRFAFVQLYELSATSVRSLWRGRCAGAKTADECGKGYV